MSIFNQMHEFLAKECDGLNLKILKFSTWHTENNNVNVDIIVEKADLQPTDLSDCSKINKLALLWLKNANMNRRTNLSVRVPGIDRELFNPQDFERFAGQQVQIELKELINNRKRYKGFIKFVKYDLITLESNSEIIELDWNLIEKASIVPDWDKIMKKVKVKNK